MFDVTALGEILIDFSPMPSCGATKIYAQNEGGAPANVLATVAKYGGSAAFIGKVGKDMFVRFLIEKLKELNIDTSGAVIDDLHNTTLAFVSLDENGDREFSFYRKFGADTYLSEDEIRDDIIASSKIFHFGSLSLTAEPARSATDHAIRKAKENGCIISFDPNYRAPLWDSRNIAVQTITQYIKYADIMKVSAEEAVMISGEQDIEKAAQILMNYGLKILLITNGEKGVIYQCSEGIGFVSSIKVKPVDTTGAGDIFLGTFLYEFIKSGISLEEVMIENIEQYIGMAVRTAGLSTTVKGAIPSIPEYEEAIKI